MDTTIKIANIERVDPRETGLKINYSVLRENSKVKGKKFFGVINGYNVAFDCCLSNTEIEGDCKRQPFEHFN